MTEQGRPKPSDELRQVASRRPHLMDHLKKFKQITGEFPEFIEEADDDHESHRPNVLYPVGGMNNSFVLEEQIATLLGYEDTRDIYDDLNFRADIIRQSIQEGIVGYHEVNELIEDYHRDGVEGLPFDIHREN